MNNPIISFDTPEERESSIKRMVSSLRFEIERAEEGSLDARSAAMLIELMPVFLRFLDRERTIFVRQAKDRTRNDIDTPLEDFLRMMTLPLVNMLGASLMTIVPIPESMGTERCQDMRLMLLRNVMDNLFSGVVGYLNSAEDQLAAADGVGDGKLHS
jgi:hypothetical protein